MPRTGTNRRITTGEQADRAGMKAGDGVAPLR